MQPTYLYGTELDREIQWRSKFSMVIPIFLGFAQMILTFAIVGLEIASVVISAVAGTLYAGFWLSVIFTTSWIAMFVLVCCHRSRRCALYVLFISLLCAAAAITLIVLDSVFIADIGKCRFTKPVCDDLLSSYRPPSIPLGRKVQVLKAQIAMAAALLATAILYILLFILASLGSRRGSNRVVIENAQAPQQVVRQYDQPSPVPGWKSTSVPVTYEPSQLECPHCGTLIKLSKKKR